MVKLAAVAVLAAALCAAAPGARAQVADGVAQCVWLKLKAKAAGFEIEDGDAGLGPKRGPSAVCYMQLNYAAPDADNLHGRYSAPILCQVDFENWAMSEFGDGYDGKALADGNVLGLEDFVSFKNDAGDILEGYSSSRMLISVDKQGAFKKATLASSSGELLRNSTFNDTPALLFGGFTVKGSSVPVTKVPDAAKALVAGGMCP